MTNTASALDRIENPSDFANWVLERLLDNSECQNEIRNRVIATIPKTVELKLKSFEQKPTKAAEFTRVCVKRTPLEESFGQLKETICDATDNFLIYQSCYAPEDSHSIGDRPRDGVAIFAVETNINHLIRMRAANRLNKTAMVPSSSSLSSVVRRVRQLFRLFTMRCLNLAPIVHLAPFASKLTSLTHSLFTDALDPTERSQNDSALLLALVEELQRFDVVVVRRLEQLLLDWKSLQKCIFNKLMNEEKRQQTPRKVIHVTPDYKPKGVLLPLDLKMKRDRIQTSPTVSVKKPKAPIVNSPKRPTVYRQCQIRQKMDSYEASRDHLRQKWASLFEWSRRDRQTIPSATTVLHRHKHLQLERPSSLPPSPSQRNQHQIDSEGLRESIITRKCVEGTAAELHRNLDEVCDEIVDEVMNEDLQL